MPLRSVDKFHSEYRSTLQWLEPTFKITEQPAVPLVAVTVAPNRNTSAGAGVSTSTAVEHLQQAHHPRNLHLQSVQTAGESGEPVIPRRKKCHAAYAYRTNEWIYKNGPTTVSEPLRPTETKRIPIQLSKSFPTSASMGTIPGQTIPIRTQRRAAPLQEKSFSLERSGGVDMMSESRDDDDSKRVTFRPTEAAGNQQHTADEKNLSKSESSGVQRKDYNSEYKERFRPFSQYEYVDGKFMNRQGDQDADRPWYAEVIELRKKAGEYKFRGWGTDLYSPSLHAAFNHQLWEQVARRSSLAPLALMTPAPRYDVTKGDKEKENARKSFTTPKSGFGRPHTATPKHPLSDIEEHKGHKDEIAQKKKLLEDSSATKKLFPKMKARSQSAGPPSRSPRKPARQSSTAASSISEKDGGEAGWKIQKDAIKPSQRHLRPSSADPSLDHRDVPPIKSPPEPTRMKSPEQALVHTPDPINWTVPLDTTKGFTVTQNIKEAPPSPRKLPGHGVEPKSSKPASFSTQKQTINGVKSSKGTDKAQVHPAAPAAKPTVKIAETKEASKYQKPVGEIKPQSGTMIRCLEDPTFMFDSGKAKPATQHASTESGVKPQQKGVRVLEAPVQIPQSKTSTEAVVPSIPPPAVTPQQVATGSKVSGTPPKGKKGVSVLEAPSDGSPTSSQTKSTGRSKASDVLEKAKHKFDKFWGKSKDEEK